MAITRPIGFRAAAATVGLKQSGKPDLCLIVCEPVHRGKSHDIDPRQTAAAVVTQNAVVGAPIHITRQWRGSTAHEPPPIRAILINAGNSNAATGEEGVEDARVCMRAVADSIGCDPGQVLPSSTGIIGRRLPIDRLTKAVPALAEKLARGEEADGAAAAAIMTTDLVPKTAHREIEINKHQVHIGAIAKGSGMIAPRLDRAGGGPPAPLGTMLAFITTDAAIRRPALQAALEHACGLSFERISVDAHPSCSDTVIVLASGGAPIHPIREGTPEFHVFQGALVSVCEELARKIVRDGEGATRTFRVEVRGAESSDKAQQLARAVVDSPLVKCAIHGKDPNWGRIVTAAGNAGVHLDVSQTSLSIGGVEVFRGGVPTGIDKSAGPADAIRAAMRADPVEIVLSVGHGPGSGWMLGCDLSDQYVRINADYLT